MQAAAAPTALMRQYLDVKARYPDAIVFFRLGDFYEMFYDDAVYVARALDLTLTSRDKGKEDPVPMCGIPHHAARGYLAKLMELGHRVALCEQLEDPRLARGIVKRDVVRIVTPGVVLDEEALDPRAPQFVAAAIGEPRQGYGLAFLDVTTGDFRATLAPTLEALLDELARAEPRELLVARDDGDLAAALRRGYPRVPQTAVDARADDSATAAAAAALADALPGGFDGALAERAPLAAAAAARVLRYARGTQPGATLPVSRLDFFRRSDTLILDEQARAHLELTETLLDRKRTGSLLDVLDQTRSAMGGRLLRRWLLFPLVDVAAIRRRQDAVERLVLAHAARDAVRKVIAGLGDIERLTGRARRGVASPRDLVALGRSLAELPSLVQALGEASRVELAFAVDPDGGDLLSLGSDLGSDLAAALDATLRSDAPALTKDGGYVQAGVSAELDELCAIASGGRDTVARIEARERERTGIATLKIRHNSVFGYYIEVTRSQLPNVPADYVRKQTVANAERFVTPELGEYEQKILSADERRITLELEIFTRLRDRVAAAADRLLVLGARVAAVDALASLAEVAHRGGYSRPAVDASGVIDIADGRHPVVERLAAAGAFVPNDVRLDPDAEQVLIVTGPNMAGKSTLIRQVALTVILAQMGGFVPARAARVGICDRVFTRVGAGDNLARGESTFLVEMRETAHILRHATARSLVVLDEIGRGTSTYDGVSIAWAVAEHLHDRVGAKTLFATHYHELCALAELHPRVRNVSVAAREWKGDIVFLRKLAPGGASRSFGVEVAKLAGLPAPVLERARAILQALERPALATAGLPRSAAPGGAESPQLGLFASGPASAAETPATTGNAAADDAAAFVLGALRALDPDDLTPRAALDLVAAWRKKLTDHA
ncbi:MAG TPA: DNA mismatch repair protein MutS [Polyangia bacterium]|nr:DNA mismatch repair protein MutS [Polyangia bacterium]